MTRRSAAASLFLLATALLAAAACKPAAGSGAPGHGVLAVIGGQFSAGPGRFVVGATETTEPERIRGAITDLFGGDPGHICFRGDPLTATSLLESAFPRAAGKQETHFEYGRLVARLQNPLDPKAPLSRFDFWPCADFSIGGHTTYSYKRITGALMDAWAGDPGKVCFHGTEKEARVLLEQAFRGHAHFDRAEAKAGEVVAWLRNPLDPKDKTPRAFPYKACPR